MPRTACGKVASPGSLWRPQTRGRNQGVPHLATLGLRRYVTAGSRGCRSPPSGHSPLALAGLSRAGIQEQLVASAAPALAAPLAGEDEEVVQAPRLLVEGEVADVAGLPVVLDEAQDRGLVGRGVVDEVCLGVRGDDDQGQPWAVAAPVLVAAGDAAGVGTARVGVGQPVVRGVVRLVDDRAHLVVVPAVTVVVGDHHGGALPV